MSRQEQVMLVLVSIEPLDSSSRVSPANRSTERTQHITAPSQYGAAKLVFEIRR